MAVRHYIFCPHTLRFKGFWKSLFIPERIHLLDLWISQMSEFRLEHILLLLVVYVGVIGGSGTSWEGLVS